MYGAKPNAYASLRKPGSDGMPGNFGPSSSYLLDNPEKREIIRI
jgi:hypothetical protein